MSKKIVYQTTINKQDYNLTLYKTDHGLALVSAKTDQPNDFAGKWLAKTFKTYQLVYDDAIFESEIKEINAYLDGSLQGFSFPLDLYGTNFQKTVWKALIDIPYGKTISYSELANAMNRPTAIRAVSRAIGQNPLLIVVPCHRVIGKNNNLTGFRSGLALKKKLINLEFTFK